MCRNQIAKLTQNRELGGGWFGISFVHLCRVTELKSHSNHFFFTLTLILLWDGCDFMMGSAQSGRC
jgi:hypothetical protein